MERAEAIWQGQHEELSSELAQAQRDAQHAHAALQRKQDTALEALQVSWDHTCHCSQAFRVAKLAVA